MTFEPASRVLAFVLPMAFKKGDVTFVASRTGEDISVPIAPANRARQVVSTAQLTKGVWRAILHWSDGRLQYQDEKEISIS